MICLFSLTSCSHFRSRDLSKDLYETLHPFLVSHNGKALYKENNFKSKKLAYIPFNSKIEILSKDKYLNSLLKPDPLLINNLVYLSSYINYLPKSWLKIKHKNRVGWIYDAKTSGYICNLYSGVYFYKNHPLYIRLDLIGTNEFIMESTILQNYNKKIHFKEFLHHHNTNANQNRGGYIINGSTLLLKPYRDKQNRYLLIISTNKLQYIGKDNHSLRLKNHIIFHRK